MKFSKGNSLLLFVAVLVATVFYSCDKKSYTDASLPAEERAGLLLKEMTLDEKIGQMCIYVGEASNAGAGNEDEKVNYTLGIGERAELIKTGKIGSFIKVPSYKETNYLQELAEQSRLKIPLLIGTDAIHGHGMYQGATTVYPTPISLASAFDTTLVTGIAKATAAEMRATGYHWAFSPNIEVVRDARWGRTGETFGEDTYMVTMMGKAMLKGYQGDGYGGPENVLACAKHFIAGGIAENGLNGAPADISERSLNEVFFPPFIELVNDGVGSVMAAHNEVNGIPCHAHKPYLTGLLKNTWGFKGIVVSDWMDIERLASAHKIAKDEKEADKLAVLAGIDMHMQGPGFFKNVKELVQEGEIPEARIDDAVRKILYAKFRLGLFENRYVSPEQVKAELQKKEHLELALKAAQESVVLLKNKNEILPLDKNIRSVFITGPDADSQALMGDWARVQDDKNITTVVEGIRNVVSPRTKVDFLPVSRYDSISSDILKTAKAKAGNADVAILVVGEKSLRFDADRTSGENLDRSTLELAGNQLELVKSVQASGTPVIVVLVNGAPVASEWTVENTDAILESWEPGMLGGQAVADILFGNCNPSGRLPITIPRTVGHLRCYYNYKPSSFHRGKFYMDDVTPLFEFGYGLSYTQFKYDNLKAPAKLGLTDDLKLGFTVQNTGKMAGDEVILIYINDKISSVTTPVKKLVAFKRISLAAGQKKDLSFVIPNTQFKLLNMEMKEVLEPGDFDIIVGDNKLNTTVRFE